MYVRGDNFVSRGSRLDQEWLRTGPAKHARIKFEGILGPDMSHGDVQELACLNCISRRRGSRATSRARSNWRRTRATSRSSAMTSV